VTAQPACHSLDSAGHLNVMLLPRLLSCCASTDVVIGSRVTIGCGSAVMPGCFINDEAVIGVSPGLLAGAVLRSVSTLGYATVGIGHRCGFSVSACLDRSACKDSIFPIKEAPVGGNKGNGLVTDTQPSALLCVSAGCVDCDEGGDGALWRCVEGCASCACRGPCMRAELHLRCCCCYRSTLSANAPPLLGWLSGV
jgi:hypothetical protein